MVNVYRKELLKINHQLFWDLRDAELPEILDYQVIRV